MGTVVLSGTAVLVVLGFGDHLYWIAAVAVLYLYARHGRGPSSTPSAPGQGSPQDPAVTPTSTPASAPTSYKAYRARRDQQAKWERRYARERGGR
ncbi:hypothetical protein AB0J81_17280 [Streptomyces bobili]|uniref:hypothetical protein n=1 Tax=Streptomyces bobili TaxID=67280 RepID=UPI0033E5B39B